MDQHINFITLGVADFAASSRFYREVFGWQETAYGNENIAFFQAGGALPFALRVQGCRLKAAVFREKRQDHQGFAKSILRRLQRLHR